MKSLLRASVPAIISISLFLITIGKDAGAQNRRGIKKSTHKHATFLTRKPFGAKTYQSIGFSLTTLNYYGDLSPLPKRISTDINFTRPGFGLSYSVRKGPRFSWQTQFIYGQIAGSDAKSAENDLNGIYRQRRNMSFRNRIKELSFSVSFDMFANHNFFFHRPKWNPYITLGASLFHHNPQALAPALDLKGNSLKEAGQWVNLRPLGTEGQYANLLPTDKNFGNKPYSLLQPSLLAGYGVRLRISDKVDLSLDVNFRYTFTDYLDDVSKNYVDLGVLESELARALSYRTNELVNFYNPHTYIARNEQSYTVEAGYGSEHRDNMRGNAKDRDIIMITSLKAMVILGKNFRKPKSR